MILVITRVRTASKRIIFDCERMRYRESGSWSYCFELGKELEKQLSGCDLALSFYVPDSEKHVFPNATSLIHKRIHKYFPPSSSHAIWHCTYQNSNYFSPGSNGRSVLTIHDLNFLYDDKLDDKKKQHYLAHLQKNVDKADVLVCVSDYGRSDLFKHCDTANKSVELIYNGGNELVTPFLGRKAYRPRGRFLFSIGAVHRLKNFHVLIPLISKLEGCELVIAGHTRDSDYKKVILENAEKLGVSNNVHLVGPVSEEEKSWYYHNCEAFMCPSNAEGFGLPVTEAMSIGKPLFVANKTSLPEIAGSAAFYFNSYAAEDMRRTFLDGMKKYVSANMEQIIKKRHTDFSWTEAAEKYVKIYKDLSEDLS